MTLQQNASEEVRLAAQLRAHVSLMPNADFRDTLKHLAEETEQSAALLAEQVRTPAASWPTPQAHEAAAPTTTSTFWRLLAADLAAVNALANRYQAQLGWMADAGQQALLYQLRAIKRRHRRTLLDLLTRIDSFAKPEINPGNASDHA
jgi:hypothetical protein